MPAPINPDGAARSLRRLEAVLAQWQMPGSPARAIYTQVYADTARDEARRADSRHQQGRPLGPLDGLLVSLKASIDVAGQVTDACSPLLARRAPADRDAPLVRQLRQAGAVIVGKTQMTELAFSGLGLNPHYPVVRNPRAPDCVTGGSSSGAAASVAAGLADVAIGGDTGGSIRIPAALCGVVGFKPARDSVCAQGVFPLSTTLDCLGPLAGSVTLCRHTHDVLAGADTVAFDPRFRLLLPNAGDMPALDPEVRNAFERGAAVLSGAGIEMAHAGLALLDQALADMDSVAVFTSPELLASLRDCGVTDLAGVDAMVLQRIQASAGISAVDYLTLGVRRGQWMKRVDAWWPAGAILALPTVPSLPPRLADMPTLDARIAANARLLAHTRSANLLDLPALSLPLPASGPPVGLMLVGARGAERHLLRAAEQIEAALAQPAL